MVCSMALGQHCSLRFLWLAHPFLLWDSLNEYLNNIKKYRLITLASACTMCFLLYSSCVHTYSCPVINMRQLIFGLWLLLWVAFTRFPLLSHWLLSLESFLNNARRGPGSKYFWSCPSSQIHPTSFPPALTLLLSVIFFRLIWFLQTNCLVISWVGSLDS